MAFQQRYYHDTSGTGDEVHANQHFINSRKRKFPVSGQSADARYHHNTEGRTWEAEIHHFEKEAYIAVVRAFKNQADTISWEKESLMSHLRQELRMSNEEHSEILGRISMESANQMMRESRRPCEDLNGIIRAGNMNYGLVPRTIGKGPLSKQSIMPSVVSRESFGLPSPSPQQSSRRLGLLNPETHTNVVNGLADPVQHPLSGRNERDEVALNGSSNFFTNKNSGMAKHCYLLGQKVRIRWPNDHKFCDAVVSRYNPARGLHALSFNGASDKDNLEWVDLTKTPPGDIQWVDDDNPEMTTSQPRVNPRGTNTPLARNSCNASAGTGGRFIRIPKSRPKSERMEVPAGSRQDTLQIKIRKTDDLIETVKRVLSSGKVDPFTVSDAKEALKEHENALIQVLESLADVSDDE